MHVLASGPGLTGPGEPGVKLVPLDELVARADVISLHCELPERLRGLVEPGPSSRSSSRARSSSTSRAGRSS
jgi:hypothetical protein